LNEELTQAFTLAVQDFSAARLLAVRKTHVPIENRQLLKNVSSQNIAIQLVNKFRPTQFIVV
jgi:hypothetical protein